MKYSDWWNIAQTARRSTPYKYRDGVEREAALIAVACENAGSTMNACVEAIEAVFDRFKIRFPHWDGSIG